MTRLLAASAVAAITAVALQPAAAAERVLVVDAPDMRKVSTVDGGFRTSDLIGTDVYSNTGRRIGEVEDFLMNSSGHFYAVVDIDDGPIEQYVELGDGDVVVVPWRELRTQARPE